MISIVNLSIQFSGTYIFDGITFTIKERDRIGLTGANGAGKSTLLKVLTGSLKADEGEFSMQPGTTIGYLPQDLNSDYSNTIIQEAYLAFDELIALNEQKDKLERDIEQITDYEGKAYMDLLSKYERLQDKLKNLDAYKAEEKIERVLKGLGFENGEFDRPMTELSGGWQMRVELAKILLKQPNYILLDEPTNHLDIESIIWLEGFLKSYSGGVVLVSHDRAFLDNVTNRTIELELGNVYDYKANYSQYLDLRVERKEKQIAAKKNQDKFIQETQVLIEKFRAKKNKAKFAQTLITKLERLEKIEVDTSDTSSIVVRFPDPPRSGKMVLSAENLSKSYGDLLVLDKLGFEIERGEKIAFVGKNGEGKTTLSKVIVGMLEHQGKCELGHNVSIGYYQQHQAEALDGNKTVFETIDDVATGDMRTKVRNLLGSFLFSGDDVHKKVKVLSGGEKGRLAMARLLLEPVNLLVLDEPTNHLDIRSKDMLKNALNAYEGTLIIVSHDRDFLGGLTDKVFEFSNKHIKKYIGDINDFLASRNISNLNELNSMQKSAKIDQKKEKKPSTEENLNPKEQRLKMRQLQKDVKRISTKVQRAEKKINETEEKIVELEKEMAAPDFYMKDPNANQKLQDYEIIKQELEKEMTEWENLEGQKAELEQKLANFNT